MSTTMKDIAERAGVSQTTVSRALNKKADIGKATRDRILAIAQELNYAPNIHARALASGDSRTLGLIVADSANPFYAKIIPANKSAEYFGFYNMLGKFAAIIGPMLMGGVGLLIRAMGYIFFIVYSLVIVDNTVLQQLLGLGSFTAKAGADARPQRKWIKGIPDNSRPRDLCVLGDLCG